jgi:hypothetical protein
VKKTADVKLAEGPGLVRVVIVCSPFAVVRLYGPEVKPVGDRYGPVHHVRDMTVLRTSLDRGVTLISPYDRSWTVA